MKIATSQFPVSADINSNYRYITAQMREAQEQGCDIIHFPEGSLSGYAGIDFISFDRYDWYTLKHCTEKIMNFAKELNIRVLLGSAHPLSKGHKPHNSLYIIDCNGAIIDRYDKLFCAGDETGQQGDLAHYTPGEHFAVFEVNGITCGVQICHDYRYPELYRELIRRKVSVVFHAYHAGNMDPARQAEMEAAIGAEHFPFNPGRTYPEITMPATMISYAANNYVWISCSNTAAKESCWAAFMVRPDGVITGRLEKNVAGILITTIDSDLQYYDSTKAWRKRSINGIFHSGENVKDPRSADRKEL